MDAKELAITITGLVATFLMPWPGEEHGRGNRAEPCSLHACTGAERCRETVLAESAMGETVRRAEVVQVELQAARRQ